MENIKLIEKLDLVRLNIQLTKKCNQRCRSCNSYFMKTDYEMSTSDVTKAIKEISNHFAIKNIAFTGGEPTLRKDILQIAETAKKFSPNVSITTNGFYCTDKSKVQELISAGINRFSFSYHSVGGQDEFTKVAGSEKRLRNAIEWVCEEKTKNKDIYVKIGTLFNGYNIDNLEKVLDYAESLESGIDVYIELLDSQLPIFAGSEMNRENTKIDHKIIEEALTRIDLWRKAGRHILLDYAGYRFMQLYFTDRDKITGQCPLGKTDIYVESNGDIKTGCWVLPSVGNIIDDDIEDILKSEAYHKNIELMMKRQCSGCTCGYLMQGRYIR